MYFYINLTRCCRAIHQESAKGRAATTTVQVAFMARVTLVKTLRTASAGSRSSRTPIRGMQKPRPTIENAALSKPNLVALSAERTAI